jgi:hypothetical protein
MEAISSIGSAISNPNFLKALNVGSTVAGETGNIISGVQKGREISALTNEQKRLLNMSPESLSALVARGTAPLSAGLTQSVGNQVQGDLAERGLAEAPGIYAATESQALAPYQQQNQQIALDEILTKLQLPLSYGNTILSGYGQPQDMSRAIMALLQSIQTPTGTQQPTNPLSGDVFPQPPPTFPVQQNPYEYPDLSAVPS